MENEECRKDLPEGRLNIINSDILPIYYNKGIYHSGKDKDSRQISRRIRAGIMVDGKGKTATLVLLF